MNFLTIVIPVYNEEENIPLIYKEILNVWQELKSKYDLEILFVNDGSSDKSGGIIEELSKTDNRVKYIEFSRNFGHQAAIEAGLTFSKGDSVIMMDADLQHPPELIIDLIKRWKEGFEIVNTKRVETEKVSLFKRISARIFYCLLNKISDTHVEHGSADFRLLDRKIVNELIKLPEKNKFYRGLSSWIGFKIYSIEYKAKQREFGSSSYSFKKMLTLARVGITSFSYFPMKLIFLIGVFWFFGGIASLILMICYNAFTNVSMFSGTAILVMLIIINNGFLVLLLGIISIYQISMFREIQNRPNFIISKKNL